jgi:zinc protease
VFNRVAYGEDHPYGVVTTAESLNALTREDVLDFYAAQFTPDGALLVITGDVTEDEALRLAESTFGVWEGDKAPAVDFAEPPAPQETTIYLVDRPDSTQAALVVGNIGMTGDDPARYPSAVMSEILGGGFNSRLLERVRETEGYAYSIGSGFSRPVDVGTFAVSAPVGLDVADEALNSILEELERLRADGVTESELDFARNTLIGSYALGLETQSALAGRIVSLWLRGIDFADLSEYTTEIAAVDAADVQAVAREFIEDEGLIIVAVGDAETLRESLEAIAPVELVEDV